MVGLDLVTHVICNKMYKWDEGLWGTESHYTEHEREGKRFNVVVYDFVVKYNILRNLVHAGCNVTVVPSYTAAQDVLEMNPDGIVLSNGPGDTEHCR